MNNSNTIIYTRDCALMQEPEEEMKCPEYGIRCVADFRICEVYLSWVAEQNVINAVFERMHK